MGGIAVNDSLNIILGRKLSKTEQIPQETLEVA
jgi:hypothetical protein